jgi:hypothetical protein
MTLSIEAAVSSNALLPLSAPSPGNSAQSGGGSFAATVVSMLASIPQPEVGNFVGATGATGVLKSATSPVGGISGGGKSSTKNAGRTDPALTVGAATLLNVPTIDVLTVDALLPGAVLPIFLSGATPATDKGLPGPASTSVSPQSLQPSLVGVLPGTQVQKITSDLTTQGAQPAGRC